MKMQLSRATLDQIEKCVEHVAETLQDGATHIAASNPESFTVVSMAVFAEPGELDEPSGVSSLQPMLVGCLEMFTKPGYEHKAEKLRRFGRFLVSEHKMAPLVCGMITEAWMAIHEPDEDMEAAPMPSDDPRRKEILLCTVQDITQQRLLISSAEITRAGNGTVASLGKWQTMVDSCMSDGNKQLESIFDELWVGVREQLALLLEGVKP